MKNTLSFFILLVTSMNYMVSQEDTQKDQLPDSPPFGAHESPPFGGKQYSPPFGR